MEELSRVWVDTDIGTDVDDALAILYLLRHPACRLEGVSTVGGQPRERAALVEALCSAYGREVPVWPGGGLSLCGPQLEDAAPHAALLGGEFGRAKHPAGEAVQRMRQAVREHPGQVTLLAIGPLTNIALLFLCDPEIPALLKQLVVMGGRFDPSVGAQAWRYDPAAPPTNPAFCSPNIERMLAGGVLEANFVVDPHAAWTVCALAPAGSLFVGIDITAAAVLQADEFRRRFSGQAHSLVRQMGNLWLEVDGKVTFHDPLAAAAAIRPELFTWRRGGIEVEREGRLAGFSAFYRREDGPHRVAAAVDVTEFFGEYWRHL